jgi:Mg-chelatase subunit ChlD
MKFASYDYLGRPKAFYRVEEVPLSTPPAPARRASHHILVLDRSGSMCGEIEAVKTMTEKVLTLEEYRDSEMLVSVISYSSAGDVVAHVERARVEDVMAPGSKHIEAIRKIRVTGLTCISQGLRAAKTLCRAGEVTCVTLHSDGYANDRSPGAEKRDLDALVDEFSALSEVFVNTIAYSSWSDFKLLSYIANACGGTCFQTPTAKELFNTLHQTAALLAGQVVPTVDVSADGAVYTTFVSVAARKVLGASGTMSVRGVKAEHDRIAYRYHQVEPGQYEALDVPVCGDGAPVTPVLAFAAAKLAEGRLNESKYALVAARDLTLLEEHARALTNPQVAAMSTAVQTVLFDGIPTAHIMAKTFGLPNANQPSVMRVLGILGKYARDIEVDLAVLRRDYKRRGVRRIPGVRNADGTVTPPTHRLIARTEWARVSSFDMNRNNATVNMLTTRAADLVDADGAVVEDVAGIHLDDLKSYNNYTVVGDGDLNLDLIPLRISNKRLHRELVDAGALPAGPFDPKATYDVRLAGRPLVAYDVTFAADVLAGAFDTVARLKTCASILAASLKEKSDAYTDDQVAALKTCYLSKALYFSPPTTTEYADLQTALSEGSVDTRISYKVDFGTPKMLSTGDLYSANEFLARHFTVNRNGVDEKKPKFDMRWDNGVRYGYKTLSARTKLNACDDLQKPIFEDFLGLKTTGAVASILTIAGYDAGQIAAFYAAAAGTVPAEQAVEAFTDAMRAVNAAIENAYEAVAPVVFYIGTTGLLPDEFGAPKAMSADDARAAFPDLSIGKGEADGTFFDVGGVILSVYPKAEYFSTRGPVNDE